MTLPPPRYTLPDTTFPHLSLFLADRIEHGAAHIEPLEPAAGLTDRNDFGMGGRSVLRGHPVPAFADDLAILHDHRTERPTGAGLHMPAAERDGMAHETGVIHGVSCRDRWRSSTARDRKSTRLNSSH